MLDKIHLSKPLVLWTPDPNKWKEITKKNYSYYIPKNPNPWNLQVKYYPYSYKLKVKGKLIKASQSSNRVNNLDLIYWGGLYVPVKDTYNYIFSSYYENIDDLVQKINTYLKELTGRDLDITTFIPEKVEFSYNLYTQFVEEYITLFNLMFKGKSYTNFVMEKQKELYSSFYIKTKAEYRDNSRQNYTVNFYNKLDEIEYQRQPPSDYDLLLAKNVLRLEVQANYRLVKLIYKENNMNYSQRCFKDLLDIEFCGKVIKKIYGRFIDKDLYNDFYSYAAARDRISQSELLAKDRKNLLKYILDKAQNHKDKSPTTETKYKKMLASLNIHHFLIPKDWHIDCLASPMRLLDQRIALINQTRPQNELTRSYYESIEVKDDKCNTVTYTDNTISDIPHD